MAATELTSVLCCSLCHLISSHLFQILFQGDRNLYYSLHGMKHIIMYVLENFASQHQTVPTSRIGFSALHFPILSHNCGLRCSNGRAVFYFPRPTLSLFFNFASSHPMRRRVSALTILMVLNMQEVGVTNITTFSFYVALITSHFIFPLHFHVFSPPTQCQRKKKTQRALICFFLIL